MYDNIEGSCRRRSVQQEIQLFKYLPLYISVMPMHYIATLIICLFFMNLVKGQEVIPLYSTEIPNSKPAPDNEKKEVRDNGMVMISGISTPSLTAFLPDPAVRNGTAIIICPGGGYHINAINHEGLDVARELTKWGIAAFVLKYRIPDDNTMINKEIGPLQDVQQAIHTVRENAKAWNIDPQKIGLMGFSAGGHLASTAATHYKTPVIPGGRTSNVRPDFLILGYPVISFTDSIAHLGSRSNLLGNSPGREKILQYSNERHVTQETPPAFLFHAADDKVVLPANSLAFYKSLLQHGVPAELHIYERGGHGFGINNPTTDEKWMSSLENWLTSRKLLNR
jgi:acetyl esterase/lipase